VVDPKGYLTDLQSLTPSAGGDIGYVLKLQYMYVTCMCCLFLGFSNVLLQTGLEHISCGVASLQG